MEDTEESTGTGSSMLWSSSASQTEIRSEEESTNTLAAVKVKHEKKGNKTETRSEEESTNTLVKGKPEKKGRRGSPKTDLGDPHLPCFKVGDRVEGYFCNVRQWYPGEITKVHEDGDGYDVQYDDGDVGKRVDKSILRRETNAETMASGNSQGEIVIEEAEVARTDSALVDLPTASDVVVASSNLPEESSKKKRSESKKGKGKEPGSKKEVNLQKNTRAQSRHEETACAAANSATMDLSTTESDACIASTLPPPESSKKRSAILNDPANQDPDSSKIPRVAPNTKKVKRERTVESKADVPVKKEASAEPDTSNEADLTEVVVQCKDGPLRVSISQVTLLNSVFASLCTFTASEVLKMLSVLRKDVPDESSTVTLHCLDGTLTVTKEQAEVLEATFETVRTLPKSVIMAVLPEIKAEKVLPETDAIDAGGSELDFDMMD